MCGIIGYTGPLEAETILLDGLSQLEYRGYDSAGIAFFDSQSQVRLLKKTGKVSRLKETCEGLRDTSHCGIGHTRWATHGGVTDENAHPHRAGRVTLIHNGIIENYHKLTTEWKLEDKLVSQTDSEAAAWILDALYDGDPKAAISALVDCLEGSYGFCIMFDEPSRGNLCRPSYQSPGRRLHALRRSYRFRPDRSDTVHQGIFRGAGTADCKADSLQGRGL